MIALFAVSSVWKSESGEGLSERPCIVAVVGVETCVTGIYILDICDTKDS